MHHSLLLYFDHCTLTLQALGLCKVPQDIAGQSGMQVHTIVPTTSITAKVKLVLKPKRWLPYPVLPCDDYWNSA